MIIGYAMFFGLLAWAVFQEVERRQHKRRVERNYRAYKGKSNTPK